MKKLFFINDSLENKISYYLLAGFLIALPFDHFYSEVLLECFVIHTLIHLRKNQLPALKNKRVWIIASIFFLNLIAISYSNYKAEGVKDITHQLGILVVPVCLSITNLNLEKYKLFLLKIFALTCTFTIAYLYIDAFRVIHFFHLSYTSIFSGTFISQNFSAPIGLHATYLSMYVALSISIFLFFFFKDRRYKNWKYIFFTGILFAGLIQLSSRSVFISMCFIIIITIPVLLFQGKKRLHFSLVSLLAFSFIILIITNVDSFKKRYINDLEDDLSNTIVPRDLSETRMKRWNLEMGLISNSPFTGYGSGSEKYILKEPE